MAHSWRLPQKGHVSQGNLCLVVIGDGNKTRIRDVGVLQQMILLYSKSSLKPVYCEDCLSIVQRGRRG